MESYSYTTVLVEPDGSTLTSVNLYPDRRMTVRCARDRARAQLFISHARANVLIAPTNPTAPTAEDVQVARQLAELFARYAAEVERLHIAARSAESAA